MSQMDPRIAISNSHLAAYRALAKNLREMLVIKTSILPPGLIQARALSIRVSSKIIKATKKTFRRDRALGEECRLILRLRMGSRNSIPDFNSPRSFRITRIWCVIQTTTITLRWGLPAATWDTTLRNTIQTSSLCLFWTRPLVSSMPPP